MLANFVTLLRLIFSTGFAIGVAWAVHENPMSGLTCFILIVVSIAEEFTDIFDGVIARRMGTVSEFGEVLDPLVDSISRLTIYFSLALAGWISFVTPLVMTFRDIMVSYTRVIKSIVGGGMGARVSGKWKAIIQGTGMPFLVLFAWLRPFSDPSTISRLVIFTEVVVIAATLWSLLDYLHGSLPMLKKLMEKK